MIHPPTGCLEFGGNHANPPGRTSITKGRPTRLSPGRPKKATPSSAPSLPVVRAAMSPFPDTARAVEPKTSSPATMRRKPVLSDSLSDQRTRRSTRSSASNLWVESSNTPVLYRVDRAESRAWYPSIRKCGPSEPVTVPWPPSTIRRATPRQEDPAALALPKWREVLQLPRRTAGSQDYTRACQPAPAPGDRGRRTSRLPVRNQVERSLHLLIRRLPSQPRATSPRAGSGSAPCTTSSETGGQSPRAATGPPPSPTT